MALSLVVKNELVILKSYYKSLYFLRWFLPTEFRKHLTTLESVNIDAINPQKAATLLMYLYDAANSSWYSRFVVFVLSGLAHFFSSDLIKQTVILKEQGLYDVDSLQVVLQCDNLETGVTGLLELKHIGMTCAQDQHITADKLAEITKIKHSNLREDWKRLFYPALVNSTIPAEFFPAIQLLQPEPSCSIYIPKLANSPNPNALAIAMLSLAKQSLLPTEHERATPATEWMNTTEKNVQLKNKIFSSVLLHPHPSTLTEAVTIIAPFGLLEDLTFNELLTSASPIDLAMLMVKFGKNVDQKTLFQLEIHRKNLIDIEKIINLNESKKTKIDYCQNLVIWLQKVKQPPTEQLLAVYDAYHDRFRGTAHYEDFLTVLELLNNPVIWRSYGTHYAKFLHSFAAYPPTQFLLYARILARVATEPKIVTAHNCTRLLDRLATCKQPEELLQRCQARSSLTAVLLDKWVGEIDAEAEDASGVFPLQQIRQRKPSRERATTIYATTHLDDLEARSASSAQVVATPVMAKEDRPFLGSIKGFVENYIWTKPVTPASQDKKFEDISTPEIANFV